MDWLCLASVTAADRTGRRWTLHLVENLAVSLLLCSCFPGDVQQNSSDPVSLRHPEALKGGVWRGARYRVQGCLLKAVLRKMSEGKPFTYGLGLGSHQR